MLGGGMIADRVPEWTGRGGATLSRPFRSSISSRPFPHHPHLPTKTIQSAVATEVWAAFPAGSRHLNPPPLLTTPASSSRDPTHRSLSLRHGTRLDICVRYRSSVSGPATFSSWPRRTSSRPSDSCPVVRSLTAAPSPYVYRISPDPPHLLDLRPTLPACLSPMCAVFPSPSLGATSPACAASPILAHGPGRAPVLDAALPPPYAFVRRVPPACSRRGFYPWYLPVCSVVLCSSCARPPFVAGHRLFPCRLRPFMVSGTAPRKHDRRPRTPHGTLAEPRPGPCLARAVSVLRRGRDTI